MDHASDKSLIAASPWWRPDPGTHLVIRGGSRLVGTYPINGAKNAVLPLMVSALLTPHLVTLHNVPAGLGAKGDTILDELDHLDRGYDGMAGKLVACGAVIARSSA